MSVNEGENIKTLLELFQGSRVKRSKIIVGVNATQIVKADTNRIVLIMTNRGASNVDFDDSVNVTVNSGQKLGSDSARVSFYIFEDGALVFDEVWGIAPTAGNNIFVFEVLKS